MKYIILIALTAVVVISCKSDKAAESVDATEIQNTPSPILSKDPVVLNTLKMLQGTWRSRDDKNTTITFENNTRIETKGGKTQGKTRYFEIADQCNNDTAKGKKIVKSEARYISMQDIDMCYFIKKITNNELVLSYVGRNNTLSYIKNSATSQRVNKNGNAEIMSLKKEK